MIILYTPKITNRVQYIAKTVLSEICGFDYKVTQSSEEYLNFKGARINYSNRDLPGGDLKIYDSGFLSQKGIKDFTPAVRLLNNIPYLFPLQAQQSKCDLDYDIFSACFYLLSRYEEYLPYMEDHHGRFEADQSLAFQMGFLELPVVDIYASELKSIILEMFPFEESKEKEFTFIPTYDIDVAYAYKGKGFARHTLLIIKDIVTLEFKKLSERVRTLMGTTQDPFDSYNFQLELQERYKLQPVYFFLSGQFGPKDRNISVNSGAFQSLVKTLGDYAQTGIHPSYASNSKPKLLKQELDFLSGILHRRICNSRQHYLKLKIPQTYHELIKVDISNDFSMGFANHTGFRAGTCTPFNFFDLSQEAETRLRIYPLIVMDGTLKDYMKLNPQEAIERVRKLIDVVKSVNGTFISLWHNDALTNIDQWEGWQEVYTQLLQHVYAPVNVIEPVH